MKGQFLERPTLIPLGPGREVLEGTAHRGRRLPPLLLLPPRPLDGGGMDHVIAAELAWAAASAGHSTLRFNYRGVGASQGERGQGPALVEDAEAALVVARENADSPSVAVAALHGAAEVALALYARHPGLAGLCLVSPVGIAPESLARLSCPLLVVVGEQDLRLPRSELLHAVQAAGGLFEQVEDDGPNFQRNLPRVGHHVRAWLTRLSGA